MPSVKGASSPMGVMSRGTRASGYPKHLLGRWGVGEAKLSMGRVVEVRCHVSLGLRREGQGAGRVRCEACEVGDRVLPCHAACQCMGGGGPGYNLIYLCAHTCPIAVHVYVCGHAGMCHAPCRRGCNATMRVVT